MRIDYRIKYAVRINPSTGRKSSLTDESIVSFVPMESIGKYGSLGLTQTKKYADVKTGYTYFEEGDVVFAKITPCFENGKGVIGEGLSNLVGYGTTELHVLRSIKGISQNRYIYYLVMSYHFRKNGESEMYGAGGQKRVPLSYVENYKLSLPPLETQKQIADFLDKETTRIDTLISKKQKQIELLQEKRQAIITQSVTKGLNCEVKMKDSGVEWIGEIPEHWEVKKIRFLFAFGRGLGISKSDLMDEGVPCISYGEIHSKFRFEVIPEKHELKCIDERYLESSRDSLIHYGDFIFADTSEDIEGSGNFSYLNSKETSFAGYHTVIMRPKNRMNSRFIAYLFDSPPHRSQIQQMVKGVKVYSITQSILKDVFVILPPQKEQDLISNYLDSECSTIDMILEKIKKSIGLLKEYRSSLITHAVSGLPVPGLSLQTGQIDTSKHEVSK